MKILLSIKPDYVQKIFSGEKKFEYRKVIFKNSLVKSIVVYATMPVGKIIGEFEVGPILQEHPSKLWDKTKEYGGVEQDFFDDYFRGRETAYAIPVKNIKKYNKPIDPRLVFDKFTAPQSFFYLKDDHINELDKIIV